LKIFYNARYFITMQQNNKQATHEVLFTDILEIVALVGYT